MRARRVSMPELNAMLHNLQLDIMWIQKDLFSDDNIDGTSDQQLHEEQGAFSPALFSATSRRVLDGQTLEALEAVGLTMLEGHEDWSASSGVVEKLGCKSLADVARLTDRQISKVRVRPLNRRDALRRLRNDVLDHAGAYLHRWNEDKAARRLVLHEGDYADLAAFVDAIARCFAEMVEAADARMGLPYIYKEYFVDHLSLDEMQNRHADTTLEAKRLKIKNCVQALTDGEEWMGYGFGASDIDAMKHFLESHVYTSVTCTHPLPHCVLAFLREFGYDVLEKRTDSMPDWDFVTLVYKEDIRFLRHFMYSIIQSLSATLLPMSQEKALLQMMNGNADVDLPYERRRLFVRRTLQSHPWIEQTEAGLRLRTSRLRRDYERYARIIYDAAEPITTEDMACRYRSIFHCSSKSVPMNVVKSKYEGFRCYGKTGYWEYVGADTDEQDIEPVARRIGRWLDDGTLHEAFYLSDIVALLSPGERKVYSLHTLSAYASLYAVKEVLHTDHFCRRGCEARHSQYKWRMENDNEAMPRVISFVVEMLEASPQHTLPLRVVNKRLRQELVADVHSGRHRRDSRLGRLPMYSASSQEEAREKGLPFVMGRDEQGTCISLCRETLAEGTVQSFQMNRRENVRRMYGLMYEYVRELLSDVPEREMELVEVIRHFMDTDAFRSQPDCKEFGANRLRAAFVNALKPRMFERVKHGRRVFIRLVEE